MSNIEFTSEITVDLVRHDARDEDVVAAARVSVLGPRSLVVDHAEKTGLISFLMKNRHGTPFEHNQFTFFTDAPILVYRELHRHRIGVSINEESGRYKELRPKFYVVPPERPLVQIGKAGAHEFVPGTPEQYETKVASDKLAMTTSWNEYQRQLECGIAKESARNVLPVAIFSSQYYTVNARSLMSILSLRKRLEPDVAKFPSKPLWEINRLADKMEEFFEIAMPVTHRAFVENGYVAP